MLFPSSGWHWIRHQCTKYFWHLSYLKDKNDFSYWESFDFDVSQLCTPLWLGRDSYDGRIRHGQVSSIFSFLGFEQWIFNALISFSFFLTFVMWTTDILAESDHRGFYWCWEKASGRQLKQFITTKYSSMDLQKIDDSEFYHDICVLLILRRNLRFFRVFWMKTNMAHVRNTFRKVFLLK